MEPRMFAGSRTAAIVGVVEIAPPFREGDIVAYDGANPPQWIGARGQSYYWSMRDNGIVQWCRMSRVGVGPVTWTVSVYWPKVDKDRRGWNGRAATCRYLATNLRLVQRNYDDGTWPDVDLADESDLDGFPDVTPVTPNDLRPEDV